MLLFYPSNVTPFGFEYAADTMADGGPKLHTVEDLLTVMARLRDPVSGCPWDVQQTFGTIAPYTIEEAYEVADAIAREDLDALKDELAISCFRSSITPGWLRSRSGSNSLMWLTRSRER
jgi:hypothetical protein